MDRRTAVALFESLESERWTTLEGDPPVYVVRLDAAADNSTGDRQFRVRVTPAVMGLDRDTWLFVLEQAAESNCDVQVQNNGLELS